jgi:hypothetical protein
MTSSLRSLPLLLTLSGLAFTGLAHDARAQQTAPALRAAPVRDGGTFHVDTGTWTRKAQSHATLGPDVLYDNTCPTGYYSALSQTTFVDEGRLPSPSAPSPTGCATNYRVDGFSFGYCTDQTAATFGTWTHRFYQDHSRCAPIGGVEPTATIALSGLPASPALGVIACWTVTIDLGVSGSFVLTADGDGSFQGGSFLDRFAWATRSSAPGTRTGPVIAGSPAVCAEGAGTAFSPVTGPGTGLGNVDSFRVGEGTAYNEGCFWFGGAVFAGFDLRLFGTACPTTTTGEVLYCFGDGGGAACPCANHSSPGQQSGCLNSLGVGARLRAYGIASLSNDSVSLLGAGMTNAPCLYFQGTTRTNGGFGTVLGDGLRCAGGSMVRLGTIFNGNGSSQIPAPNEARISVRGGVTSPGSRSYQIWYRNVAPFCTPSGFNLSNGLEIFWGV